jgi:curli biogenesis system outer membrane secretion channel CsgG
MICRNKTAVFAVIVVLICMAAGITAVFAAQLRKTIAVSDFEDKAGYSDKINLGSGIADQLTDALIRSGNFVVVERQTVKSVPAQILIKGTVTKFNLRKRSRDAYSDHGVDRGGSPWQSGRGGVGGFRPMRDESYIGHVAVNLRLIDATSGEVLDTFKVKGEGVARSIGKFDFGTAGSERTSLGKALQKTIDKAVTKIAKRLRKVPFTGKIIKVEEGTIYTDIGAKNGVTAGETFNVYDSEKTKVGSIVITSVEQKRSEAAPKTGESFKNGYIVTK